MAFDRCGGAIGFKTQMEVQLPTRVYHSPGPLGIRWRDCIDDHNEGTGNAWENH